MLTIPAVPLAAKVQISLAAVYAVYKRSALHLTEYEQRGSSRAHLVFGAKGKDMDHQTLL